MAAFAIYTYKFRNVDNIGFFVNDQRDHTPLVTLEEKQKFLQAIFRDDINGTRPLECYRYYEHKNPDTNHRERQKMAYKSKTVWENNGIIVLMVSNRTKLTKHENFKKIAETDEPWCHVVIDNRSGREFVAIEKNSAFRSQDTVAEILEHSLRDRFTPHHVNIEILNQYQPAAFWDVIERHKGFGIQEVAFHFAAPNNPWASELIGNLNKASKEMHARPTTVFSMCDGDPIEVNPKNKELDKYVKVCAAQGEDITVKVIGIRSPIHIMKVKDKYVFKNMDDRTLRALAAYNPSLFDDDYSAVATFLNQIKPIEDN